MKENIKYWTKILLGFIVGFVIGYFVLGPIVYYLIN